MQMEFGSEVETLFAMAATSKWLKELLTRIERGILDMGLVIEKKEMWKYEEGGVEPVFTVKRPNSKWTIQLRFWNTIMEFLSIDRDERPMRFDLGVMNDGYAEKKIDDLVKSRLAIADALATSNSPEEVRKKVIAIGKDFARLRIWEMRNCPVKHIFHMKDCSGRW